LQLITIALVIAVVVGILLGAGKPILPKEQLEHLALPATLILRALSMLATLLIFLSIINTLMTADLPGGAAKKLGVLLTSNTLVAIGIGLFVANVVRPGQNSSLVKPSGKDAAEIATKTAGFDPWQLLSCPIRLLSLLPIKLA
jgi:Na+/H+-dicarboxylate symporter